MIPMKGILASSPATALVLDVGSSAGSFASTSTRARAVWVGLRFQGAGGNMFRLRADAARLPFRPNTFEAVISSHSLGHLEDLEEALSEIGVFSSSEEPSSSRSPTAEHSRIA